MSKLGFNISRWTRDIADYAIALQPSIIVGILPDESDWALLADILDKSPDTVHLWRPTLPHSNDNDNLNADPDKLADFVIEQYRLRPGLIHAVQGRNEAINSENLDVQLKWEHRFCDRVQAAGIPYVCLSSGVGKLEPSDFDNPRLRELVDKSAAVGCHPYLPPGQADLGSPDDLYYVDRPALLWPAGLLAKTIASEFGPYYSPYVADRLGRAVFSSQKHADLLIRKHKHFEAQGYLATAAFTLAAQGKFKNDGAEPWEMADLPPEQTDNLGLVTLVAFQQSQPARRVQFVIPGQTTPESQPAQPGAVVETPTAVDFSSTGEVRTMNGHKLLQVWQWGQPTQAEVYIEEAIALCQRFGYTGVSVKAIDGTRWMGDVTSQQNQPEALRSLADIRLQAQKVHAANLYYAVWTNPLGEAGEADLAGSIAALGEVDALFLDVEPYDQFWGAWRPEGEARAYMERIRELAPRAYIVLQPDPRAGRLAEIRPEEWLPYCNAIAGQHYFSTFGVDPLSEMDRAVGLGAELRAIYPWLDLGVYPTLPSGSTDPGELAQAVRRLEDHGVRGIVHWRMGDANIPQLEAVGGFVPWDGIPWDVGPTPAEPAPTPEVPTSEPASVTLSAAEVQEMRAALQELHERVTYIEKFLVID